MYKIFLHGAGKILFNGLIFMEVIMKKLMLMMLLGGVLVQGLDGAAGSAAGEPLVKMEIPRAVKMEARRRAAGLPVNPEDVIDLTGSEVPTEHGLKRAGAAAGLPVGPEDVMDFAGLDDEEVLGEDIFDPYTCDRLFAVYGADDILFPAISGSPGAALKNTYLKNADCINYWLTREANIWAIKGSDLVPVLHSAVSENNTELVRRLLQYKNGADDLMAFLQQVNAYGETPLHLAALSGFQEIVEMLLNAVPPAKKKDYVSLITYSNHMPVQNLPKAMCSALDYAAREGHLAIVKKILDVLASNEEKSFLIYHVAQFLRGSAFTEAVMACHLNVVQYFMNFSPNDVQRKNGVSVLKTNLDTKSFGAAEKTTIENLLQAFQRKYPLPIESIEPRFIPRTTIPDWNPAPAIPAMRATIPPVQPISQWSNHRIPPVKPDVPSKCIIM